MKRLYLLVIAATVICSAAFAQRTSVSLLYDGHYWSDVVTHQPQGWVLTDVLGLNFDVPLFLLAGVGETGGTAGVGGYVPVRFAENATFNIGLSFSWSEGTQLGSSLFVGFSFTPGG